MNRRVIWDHGAVEQLLQLAGQERGTARRVVTAVRAYAAGQRADVKKLAGRPGEWRLRIGSWRVVFAVDPDAQAIVVLQVTLRRDAY